MTMAQAVPKGYFAKNIDAAGDPGLKGKPAFIRRSKKKPPRVFVRPNTAMPAER